MKTFKEFTKGTIFADPEQEAICKTYYESGQANALPENAEVIEWHETLKEPMPANTLLLVVSPDESPMKFVYHVDGQRLWTWWSYPPKGPSAKMPKEGVQK